MMPCEICGEIKDIMDMHDENLCKRCWVHSDDKKCEKYAVEASKARRKGGWKRLTVDL